MKVEMNRRDLLELYQLTVMYARCYDLELGELLEGISETYRKIQVEKTSAVPAIRDEPGGKECIQKIRTGRFWNCAVTE